MHKYIVTSLVVISINILLFLVCSEPVKPDFRYTLELVVKGNGSLTTNPQKDKYEEGDSVAIEAIPEQGYRFCLWNGDIGKEDSTKTPIIIIMNSDKKITASFVSEDSCIILQPGTDLNKKIKEIVDTKPSYRRMCPQPGLYLQGTVKGRVEGKMKIIIENRKK